MKLHEEEVVVCWILVCEDEEGQTIGISEYADVDSADRAYEACIVPRACLYKQVCRTQLVRCTS